MVIMIRSVGQLGNKLFTFGHFIANAIENNYTLVNPCFEEYSKYFETTSKDDFGGYPITVNQAKYNISSSVTKLFYYKSVFFPLKWISSKLPLNTKLIVDRSPFFDLNTNSFTGIAKTKTVYAYGWLFRDKRNFNKHGDIIRRLFAPLQTHQNNVELLITKCKQTCDILIGVHMRKGDYATYANGQYYYDTKVYAEKMHMLKNMFSERNQKASFLVCSNEPFDTEDFPGLDVLRSTDQFIEDMYSLAKCDYIIGPPSSYSTWASFYGKTPLCILRSKEQPITLDDFKVYVYYDEA